MSCGLASAAFLYNFIFCLCYTHSCRSWPGFQSKYNVWNGMLTVIAMFFFLVVVWCRCSSNDHSNRERLEDSEKVTGSLLLLLENQISGHRADRSKKREQGAHGESLSEESLLGSLVGDLEWFLESDGRAQFVCNALLLFETSPTRTISKIHWSLTERLLTVKGVAANNGAMASRALAKKLLKTHPQAGLSCTFMYWFPWLYVLLFYCSTYSSHI